MIGAIKGFPYFWRPCHVSVIFRSIFASSAVTRLGNFCPKFSPSNYRVAYSFFPKVQRYSLSTRLRIFMSPLHWKILSTCPFWKPWLVACPSSLAARQASANTLWTAWTEYCFTHRKIRAPLPPLSPCCSNNQSFCVPLEKTPPARLRSSRGTTRYKRSISFLQAPNLGSECFTSRFPSTGPPHPCVPLNLNRVSFLLNYGRSLERPFPGPPRLLPFLAPARCSCPVFP